MRRALVVLTVLVLTLLAACSPGVPTEDPGEAERTPSATATADADPSPADPSTSAGSTTSAEPEAPEETLPPVRSEVSLPALMRETIGAGRIQRTRELASTERWRSWAVTYTVNGATVSGELLVPTGEGPFPALVLNHGYIDPAIYTLGRGMSREQEWFADRGYVVLHTDYRGHAESDPVPDLARETRLVYTRDAIGAAKALRKESYVDGDRLAYVGRSMGGGITYNALVADPDLVQAAVVFAPVSSNFVDNLRQFTEPNRPSGAQAFYDRFGTPRERPAFYRGLSSRSYFDRIEVPVLIHHGDLDDVCPPQWSRDTRRAMARAGVDVQLETWQDGHAFGPAFADSMRRTVTFLDRRLGA